MTQLQTSARTSTEFLPPPYPTPHVHRQLEELLGRVSDVIAPVWPLKDYVAVNPYQGISDRPFLDARAFLKVFSDCETLMPVAYYRRQFRQGGLASTDIEAAVNELRSAGVDVQRTAEEVVSRLEDIGGSDDHARDGQHHSDRRLRTIAEHLDAYSDTCWSETIRDEVSKHCAAHYDDGQAVWSSPWKHLPLYQAWRSAALHDRNVEALGVCGFRAFVAELPQTPEAAIVHLMNRLGVPESLWESFLLCQAFSVPGWSAWAKYNDAQDDKEVSHDFVGLLAMRLAYDVGLSRAFATEVNWDSLATNGSVSFRSSPNHGEDDSILRLTLLRASELSFQKRLLTSINQHPIAVSKRVFAQMVFCIDVRSERIRRQLESVSPEIETFGFAGFFGMPIEYVSMGETHGSSHVPVLLKPQFQLHEGLHPHDPAREAEATTTREKARHWQKRWKSFQGSAIGCFSFVETTGLLYGYKLLRRAIGARSSAVDPQRDGLDKQGRDKSGPTLRGLNQQGMTTSRQVALAESMLRNLGMTKNFSRLVVFCGHVSETENNPLAAGLDCGACGGHSGEPNARLAAMLLNQPYIRHSLADRGILIPADTFFLAAVHNTTTDLIEYFDHADVPASHAAEVEQLMDHSATAAKRTRRERMPTVASTSMDDLLRRAADWSEVRPEWGLAGNAAFVVAPRSFTRSVNLDARSFLHSYDHRDDPDGAVLETIMTAPMIVAHWINMQYYASTVDNAHFGSGSKTVHNVVGKFGILSGNGGDLMTGLPWQSLHTGEAYQHLPMRLQALIAAPRQAIERVIEKHESVANLLTNGWLHLIALDDGVAYRYTEDGDWQMIESAKIPEHQSVC